MPRRQNIDPSIPLKLKLPLTVRTRLDLYLFSTVEGRVPQGKYQEFFIERIREFFDWRRLDLQPYGYPQGYFIAGPKDMLELVEASLKARRSDVT